MQSQSNSELQTLIYKRGNIKGQLTRFNNFLSDPDNKENVLQLTIRLQKIEPLYDHFNEIHTTIELLDKPDPIQQQEFEEAYFDILTRANYYIEAYSKTRQISDELQAVSAVKLPVINLPTFDGSYDQWLNFYDTFKALIHNNNTLTDIQKFHYLRSSITNDAAKVLHSLEVSSENYKIALDLLRERFENKRMIVNNHIRAILDIPQIIKESHQAFRELIDNLLKNIRALKSLGQPVDSWDTLLIYIVSAKLDNNTKREWESSIIGNDVSTLKEFTTFLTNKCYILESVATNSIKTNVVNNASKQKPFNKFSHQSLTHITTQNNTCDYCKNNHSLYQCQSFLNLPIADRIEQVRKLKLCTNCFRSNHIKLNCYASGCKFCSKKHNTLLHISNLNSNQNNRGHDQSQSNHSNNNPSNNNHSNNNHSNNNHSNNNHSNNNHSNNNHSTRDQASSNQSNDSSTNTTIATHSTQNIETQVLLSTAIIYIYDKNNKLHECRVLLDSGSQSNFMTVDLCNKLRLDVSKFSMSVTGINQTTTNITKKTKTIIKSRHNAFQSNVDFFVIPKITQIIPALPIKLAQITIPSNITLADPSFNIPGPIDLLLGASIFWDLLCVGQIRTSKNQPVIQKTQFGWIISGTFISGKSVNQYEQTSISCFSTQSIENQLTQFWQVEGCELQKKMTTTEKRCEEYFKQTTFQDESGHFTVRLPFKDELTNLGDSKQMASKRLQSVERRFKREPELKQPYLEFMREYLLLGHMAKQIPDDDSTVSYYLPHHAVKKESSTTTKLRVVFDGSAKTDNGLSLNDTLLVGPTIQDNLFNIVIRFRTHQYVFTADIAKMYRQINIHKDDRHMQRILWRFDESTPINTYTLNTVTYGTSAAPYLAIRCLHEVAYQNMSHFPTAAKVILKDFYVDDLLSGTNSIETAKLLKTEISNILKQAGFHLRKWNSNNENIVHSETCGNEVIPIGEHKESKTLGLLWNSKEDIFQYSVKPTKNQRVTKRTILSTIAQIFDPLGLIGPATIKAKLIIQKLWTQHIDWDETVSQELYILWIRFVKDLETLNHIKIPRHVLCIQPEIIQLHGFCDSSELAYGACLYLRSTDNTGNHIVRLLCAKSKVAPLKNITLPKLELCGALLLAKLSKGATESLNINISQIYHWSDSTIALAWITGESNRWKTFVANRVSEIQCLTESSSWHHVPTKSNPADIISRGINPQDLENCSLWWNGPKFLYEDETSWPLNITIDTNNLPEERTQETSFVSQNITDFDIFTRYSTLTKLQRVIAYCIRFKINTLKFNDFKQTGPLTTHELSYSLLILLKLTQYQEFSTEINSLKLKNQVERNSKLLNLNPILDKDGLLRVGGRLSQSELPYDQKHPIILPSKHPLTKLIIRYEHIKHLHAGTQTLLAIIRLKYWPILGRNSVKRVIHNCIKCFRVKPVDTNNIMGNLPTARLTPAKPFNSCGVDYAGPIQIKTSNLRNYKIVKAYICIFVCFCTRAIHIELVNDLTTESFINALKRFISRRGKPSEIFSDNGTNFVGARNELLRLTSGSGYQQRILEFTASDQINWNFIPPKAPHFGGLWEASVKSTKYHLKRILGNALLTFEELYTVLTQIEAILNSRPLTPMTDDPFDLNPLTPGHFLIGDALVASPQANVLDVPYNRLTRFNRLQQLTQQFWNRWTKEYLCKLQIRTKWKFAKENGIKIGTMVIVKEDNLPNVQKWQMGRIVELHPGADNVLRVVSVRVGSGIVKRSITKICVLPLDTDN